MRVIEFGREEGLRDGVCEGGVVPASEWVSSVVRGGGKGVLVIASVLRQMSARREGGSERRTPSFFMRPVGALRRWIGTCGVVSRCSLS